MESGRPTFINHPEEGKKCCSRYVNYSFASIEKSNDINGGSKITLDSRHYFIT